VAVGAGVWWGLSRLDPDVVSGHVRALGPLGPLAIFLLFVVQCVVAPIPSEPVMMAAGFAYGPAAGFALSWAGVVTGAAACFALARRFGRSFTERFLRPDRLEAAEAWVRERGVLTAFAAVLLIRLTAFSTFDVLSYACGLVRVPFAWFLAATVLGAVPKVLAFTWAGAHLTARPAWVDGLILAGTFGLLVLVPFLARRWRPARAGRA
jgi:uncharacterized membrane protein YdjX (TVP38/TMEM64 family)